jgi:galactose-1-phosphate uridylyltransferase
MSLARATAMSSESGTWLKRPLSTFCNDDATACDAVDQRPRNKRARVDTFDDATQRLFEQLQQHVGECIAARARKDEQNRAQSRRIATEHPLTFPALKATAATRPRSVSPYFAASSPAEEMRTVCTKDTPHLAPTPVCSTPLTTLKAEEHRKGVESPLEPPALSI